MLSNMEPNHPFRSDIEIINSKIVAIVTTINATMNEAETANLLRQACRSMEPSQESLVVPGRHLVREVTCACKMENGKAKKEARVLILNDMVVVATMNRSFFSAKASWQYRLSVSIARMVLEEEGEASLVVGVVSGGSVNGDSGLVNGGLVNGDSGLVNGGLVNGDSDLVNGDDSLVNGDGSLVNSDGSLTDGNHPTPTHTNPLFTLTWENPSEKDAFQNQIRQLQSQST